MQRQRKLHICIYVYVHIHRCRQTYIQTYTHPHIHTDRQAFMIYIYICYTSLFECAYGCKALNRRSPCAEVKHFLVCKCTQV